PVPQQSKRDVQLSSDCTQFLSVQNSPHRRDLKLAAEPSPAVARLFHEPLFFLRPLSFFHKLVSHFWGSLQTNAQFLMFNSDPRRPLVRLRLPRVRIGNSELSTGQIPSVSLRLL